MSLFPSRSISASMSSGSSFTHDKVVRDVLNAAQDVANAAIGMTGHKNESRKLSNEVQRIATCVETSSLRAHHAGRALVISVPARCALTITKDIFKQCVTVMTKETGRDMFKQLQKQRKRERQLTVATGRSYYCGTNAAERRSQRRFTVRALVLVSLGIAKGADHRLEVSGLTPAYDGIKAVILGMVNMTEGLPWPLKAIPQTVLQIVKHVENGMAAAARITELLAEVQSQWELVAEWNGSDIGNERLRPHIEAFFENVFCVFIRLRILHATHPIRRVVGTESFDNILQEESRKFSEATEKLKLSLALSSSSAIDRVEGQIGSLVVAVNGVAELVTPAASTNTNAISSDGNISRIPPPQPHVFHGRGIGKTSLALAVLHSERIVAKFDQRIFFLSCEPYTNAAEVITALAKLFSVTTTNEPLQAIVSHLASHPHTILVLDNLETVWLVRDDTVRSQTELLLRHLGAIKTLSLVITCRGIILPRGIAWANASTASLEPFSAIAAIRTFDEIAGTSENDAESERTAVVDLITAVDCMPLAVNLLAELVQCGNKPFDLLRHWNKSHTAMLQTYPNGRESNVAASIEVSISLLTAGSNGNEPLQLLAICAHLPSGLRTTVFDQLKPHFEDLDSASRCLRSFALISAGPQGELKMLSPIRHFPCGEFTSTLLQSAPTRPSEEFTTKSTAVAAEYENLNVFLLHLINSEEPSQSLSDAVHAVSAMHTCCTHIGQTYLQLGEYSSAINALLQASEIFNGIGNRWSAARCASMLGDCQRNQGFDEVAVQRYTAARHTFLELHDHLNASVCLMKLGDIAANQGKYEDAKQYLTSARSAFTGVSKHRLYAAHCSSSLGEIYTFEGNFATAETELQTAQSEYQAIGHQWGIIQCMRLLGDLRRRQRDFSSAEELLVSAREQFIRMGMPLGQACCIYDIGLLRDDQGRVQEALEAFRTAAQIYERIGAARDLEIAGWRLKVWTMCRSRASARCSLEPLLVWQICFFRSKYRSD
ncbi:hypothetical protein BKA62DRAFT_797348 [Auriculariales sp. MPI-PUGE-AT-0066]|nr:hypothetical protein BKA62DRAFT_797348 [Auriculariales sp. MPI-PUGE-AT-0066]